jgi:hypothetical protein
VHRSYVLLVCRKFWFLSTVEEEEDQLATTMNKSDCRACAKCTGADCQQCKDAVFKLPHCCEGQRCWHSSRYKVTPTFEDLETLKL